MFNPFSFIEKLLYRIRDIIWKYPDFVFEENSSKRAFFELYKASSPASHFVLASVICIILFFFFFVTGFPSILGSNTKTYIEAVVLGTDAQGELQKLNKINPLTASNIQLEKDLVELIYEPLFRYEYIQQPDGTYLGGVVNVLTDDIIKIQQGANYEMQLKKGVNWHDKTEFTANDVIRTFELLSLIDRGNAYTQALKQMQWEKIDDYTVRICTKMQAEQFVSCASDAERPILSNFLELISFKIIPEHLSNDIDPLNLNNIATLFRNPIGTGPFMFSNISDNGLTIVKNPLYHDGNNISKIDIIEFHFYKNIADAVAALKSGEVHALATNSVEYKKEIEMYPQITTHQSPILDNQFWALYFNLRKRPDGSTIAPEFLSDVRVRKAISAAINRSKLIQDALDGVGSEAKGPIPQKSYFFNKETDWFTYNSVDIAELLDEAGWKFRGNNQYRTNDKGQTLRFSLYYVNSYDRRRVAESIKADLQKIGIDAVVDRREQQGGIDNNPYWSLDELNSQILSTRLFDVVLYGMDTFVDPDRFELYHSTQIGDQGLNISGYQGSVQTVAPNENKQEGQSSLINVSKVDRWLELARSFDPEKNKEDRKERYDEVQTLIAEDVPLVYLYHPQFLYFVNNVASNISLDNVVSIENRFRNISKWELK